MPPASIISVTASPPGSLTTTTTAGLISSWPATPRVHKDIGAFEIGHPYHAETPRLYRNHHDGTFEDVTAKVHLDRAILPMGANFGDLDNDGWLDLYLEPEKALTGGSCLTACFATTAASPFRT